MTKTKSKATTRKKKKAGGQLNVEKVKEIEENPQGAEGEELEAIFQDDDRTEIISGEDEVEEEVEEDTSAATDPFFISDDTELVSPTLRKAGVDVEEEEEEVV